MGGVAFPMCYAQARDEPRQLEFGHSTDPNDKKYEFWMLISDYLSKKKHLSSDCITCQLYIHVSVDPMIIGGLNMSFKIIVSHYFGNLMFG